MQTYFVNTQSSDGDGTTNATSGATAAYASLQAAVTGIAADFTAETPSDVTITWPEGGSHTFANIAVQIVCDMGSPRVVDTTRALVDGFTLDATHRLLIRAADGSTIEGESTNDSRNKGVFNAGYKVEASDAFTGQITVSDGHTILVDVEGESTGGSSSRGIRVEIENVWLVNCLGISTSEDAIEYHDNGILVNCIAKSTGNHGYNNIAACSGTRIYNCGSPSAVNRGFATDLSEAGIRNCWAVSSTADDFHDRFAGLNTESNNASEDTTAPGTSPQTGLVLTAGTDFVDHPNGDYSPASGGKLDGNGADLSADGDFAFDFDITGATRTQWDIGPFAVAAAGGATGGTRSLLTLGVG